MMPESQIAATRERELRASRRAGHQVLVSARTAFAPTLSPLIALATGLLVGLLIGLTPHAASARDDVPDEVARRKNPVTLEESELRYYKRQFKGKCARCHGADGAGGSEPLEPSRVPPADFTDARYMATRSDGQLFYQILMGGGERCAMPAFGPESDHAWNEEKIWHMVAFVRRFAQ